ncbi:EAL domain-containing response regulator [Hahella ganghwensis]|uniref:EAL domain-containing response regulator n=1 Tax=Hahella ganghwensis TaxID=286420 RepID=UPI000476D4CB|nr:EAL domain-containing response regulator [Hahella ganghwensis]
MLSHLKVLVVDDDPTLLKVMEHQLGRIGVAGVTTTSSSKSALDLIKSGETEPDILLCDLRMPQLDGPSFLNELAAIRFKGGIIIISGEDQRVLDTVHHLAESQSLKMIGRLKKPIQLKDLKSLLLGKETQHYEESSTPIALRPLSPERVEAELESSLRPFYQPKWDVRRQRVTGVEVLARWKDSTRGYLAPFFFIPVAEEYGLMDKLTFQLLMLVLQDIKRLEANWPDFHYAINFSVETLEDRELPNLLEQLLLKYGVSPSQITLEVTESRISRRRSNMLEVLTRLHLLGFSLSIDDFGTGYSSLDRLKEIPFSELKIDRGFVSEVTTSHSHGGAIVRSSIQLARDFNMKVVAEGVETRDVFDCVADIGCDTIQGYFIARPMGIEDFIKWLEAGFQPPDS